MSTFDRRTACVYAVTAVAVLVLLGTWFFGWELPGRLSREHHAMRSAAERLVGARAAEVTKALGRPQYRFVNGRPDPEAWPVGGSPEPKHARTAEVWVYYAFGDGYQYLFLNERRVVVATEYVGPYRPATR